MQYVVYGIAIGSSVEHRKTAERLSMVKVHHHNWKPTRDTQGHEAKRRRQADFGVCNHLVQDKADYGCHLRDTTCRIIMDYGVSCFAPPILFSRTSRRLDFPLTLRRLLNLRSSFATGDSPLLLFGDSSLSTDLSKD